MEIKTSLKQLVNLFAHTAANEEAPTAVRQFAAQMTILTAHVERVEAKSAAETKKLDSLVAELASFVIEARKPTAPAAATPDAAFADEPTESEEEETQRMVDEVERATQEELAKLAQVTPSPETDIAQPSMAVATVRKNGGKKPQNAGDAA